jgi:amino-acid racemase
VVGVIRAESRRRYLEAADALIERGAEGISLGCPEIELLLDPSELPVPTFDTTRLHAWAAVDAALAG